MQYNRDYNSSSKYGPCSSNNSMSGCYGSGLNKLNNDEINYGYVRKNIQKLNEGTIYLLKLVEKRGFNDRGIFELKDDTDRDAFLEKYGKDLPDICEQLYEANISCLTYSRWDYITLSKMTIDNAREQYISFYYDTTKTKNEKFLTDANEMAKSGFYLHNFARIRTKDGWKDTITYKGYIATFKKQLC